MCIGLRDVNMFVVLHTLMLQSAAQVKLIPVVMVICCLSVYFLRRGGLLLAINVHKCVYMYCT